MTTSLPAGSEERRVRAARRFGVIGVIATTVYMVTPLLSLTMGMTPFPGFGIPLALLFVAALVLHLWRIRELTRSLGSPAPVWFRVVACAVGIGISLVGIQGVLGGLVWGIVGGVLLGDVIGGLRARVAAIWVIASTAAVFALGVLLWWLRAGPNGWDPAFVLISGLSAFFVLTMWTLDVERLWWLKAVTDLDDSRRTAAELATARERLRLADDLHDILGHALEVVAFKSELAARLQDVDGERARAEMEQVQQVARQSLAEVRALVRDTRTTDLATEITGARAVLEPSGIVLVVRGDPATVGATARNVLGRVLREAMTNVLRHAQPSHCTIEIDVTGGRATLTVVNDGALAGEADGGGTGLDGLRRYLSEHAGDLDAGPTPDGSFRLSAAMPVGV